MQEEWRPVVHPRVHRGYEISSCGRMRNRHGRLLTPSSYNPHYHRYQPYGPCGPVSVSAAEAVLEAFVSARPSGYTAWVNHKDGNYTNFHPSNLEWVSVHPKRRIAQREIEHSLISDWEPLANEEWRPVVDQRVADGYQISNYGRLQDPKGRLLPKLNHGGQGDLVHYHPLNTASHRQASGLPHCDLAAGRAVLTAFSGPPPEGAYCGYLDGDRTNLRVENLEWSLNVAPKGEAHGQSKLTEAEVREIRAYPRYRGSQQHLAKKYGVTFQTINLVVNGKIWKHVQ